LYVCFSAAVEVELAAAARPLLLAFLDFKIPRGFLFLVLVLRVDGATSAPATRRCLAVIPLVASPRFRLPCLVDSSFRAWVAVCLMATTE
jgi:hypothetical protein